MAYLPVCWSYSKAEKPPIPIIPIYIGDNNKSNMNRKEFFKVDSGFAGAIGITASVINALEIKKFGLTTIESPTGVKKVPYYQIYVENAEWGLSMSLAYAVETPRLLAGRALFTGKKLLLDFEEEKTCFLT